ncbi:MAG: hypothetical protein B7Z55_06225 [Planctomycetales bacterium 12-60-4]|nr:MAG: hypothetical protein B7Z55_06225 [Planctomycetales bacterium 12-60-4]
MATAATKPATLEDFLQAEAQAPEGTRLALIDGEIVEWGANMTTRNSRHSTTMLLFGTYLNIWLATHKELKGVVTGGEARCRLSRNPDRIVGLDVAVFFGEEYQHASCFGDQFEGPPAVAIEILSGSDTHEDVVERIRVFLDAGVRQVWIVDAELRRVTINRADNVAQFFTARDELTAEPELPNFCVHVDALFPHLPTESSTC